MLICSTDKNPPHAGKAYETREITIELIVCNNEFLPGSLVLAHDASSSILTWNSDERYGIPPKNDEFISLVKFDSLVHLPDSKSIYWQNKRCRLLPWRYRTASVSQFYLFRPETVKPFPGTPTVFSIIILEFVNNFQLTFDPQHCTAYVHYKRRLLSCYA